jgi:ribosomal-protein-alanine N-acetyltransferase
MCAVVLRDMEESDLPRVLEVENASYSVPWSALTFRGLLRRPDAEVIVATESERIIGHSVYWHVLDQAELGNVAVAPEARARGIGARLVAEIIERASRRGVRELFLEVRPSNANARHIYQKFGFEQVGRRRNYYQLPTEDALVLRRLMLEPATNRFVEK